MEKVGAFEKIGVCIFEQAGFLSIMYLAIVLLVALDLWSGVQKAKKRGEARMSYGYRRTIDKLSKYFNSMFVVGVVDLMILFSPVYETIKIIPAFPYLSLLGVLFVAFIELKSIREKAEDKQQFKSASVLAGKVIASRDDISKIIEEVISYIDTPDKEYLKKNKKTLKKDVEGDR